MLKEISLQAICFRNYQFSSKELRIIKKTGAIKKKKYIGKESTILKHS